MGSLSHYLPGVYTSNLWLFGISKTSNSIFPKQKIVKQTPFGSKNGRCPKEPDHTQWWWQGKFSSKAFPVSFETSLRFAHLWNLRWEAVSSLPIPRWGLDLRCCRWMRMRSLDKSTQDKTFKTSQSVWEDLRNLGAWNLSMVSIQYLQIWFQHFYSKISRYRWSLIEADRWKNTCVSCWGVRAGSRAGAVFIVGGWAMEREQKIGKDATGWWFHRFLMLTPNPGEMIQFDEHIFPMGWFNHQPVQDGSKNQL